MSQFMQSVKESRANGSRSNFEFQANICLQITGFDLEAEGGARVLGVARSPAWAIGKEFSIRLQNEQESVAGFRQKHDAKANEKFFKTRPSIEKLANGYTVGRNDIEPMAIGGFLMMYGCVRDGKTPDGAPELFKAQYPQNFGNDPSRDVMCGVARVTYREAREENGKKYAARGQMEILSPENATKISSIDDLRAFYDNFMGGEYNGVQYEGMAALRLVENLPAGAGQEVRSQVFSGFAYASRCEIEVPGADGAMRKIKVPASAEANFAALAEKKGLPRLIYAALSGEREGLDASEIKGADAIAADFASGALRIEAIPGRVLPIVGGSLEEVMDPESALGQNAARCKYQAEDGKSYNGFVRLTTGTMSTPVEGAPDSIIVTKFATDVGAKGMSINSVKTPNVIPVFGMRREQQAEQQAQKAAAENTDAMPGVDHDNRTIPQANGEEMTHSDYAMTR